MVLIYVDDIIVTGNDSKNLNQFISKLNKSFALKDLGDLHYFLGIEVYRDETGIYLTQTKYIEDLLKKRNLEHLKHCPTPMAVGKPISKSDGEPMSNPFVYRSAVGALQYLTNTRPYIAFAVNKLIQFMHEPFNVHWNVVKSVRRYLKGTMNLGLHISQNDRLPIQRFLDADYGVCVDNRRSVGGYFVFRGDILVSWSSKKQNVVSRSSTKSEYRALAHVAAEITWIQSLLTEFGYPISTSSITWCDNMGASALAANPVYHA
ncbi:hypothetical protein UlMin_040481 [Ulmus minor]